MDPQTITILIVLSPSVILGLLLFLAHRSNRRLREQVARYRHLANVDPVTGKSNRAGFDAKLARFVQMANRLGERRTGGNNGWLGLVLLDIDDFKKVNDRHGHLAGDNVLRAVAEEMERCVRPGDIVARTGGDELGIILPGADDFTVKRIAQEVHARVRRLLIDVGDDNCIGVTCSTGAISRQGPGLDRTMLYLYADRRLYRSKKGKGTGDHAAAVDSERREAPGFPAPIP